jgi:hypothetical protein
MMGDVPIGSKCLERIKGRKDKFDMKNSKVRASDQGWTSAGKVSTLKGRF